MLFPAAPSSGLTASPINELREVEHDRHHDSNLETVEEIHGTSASTSVHHGGTNIQHGRKDHRPTSGADNGWDRQAHGTNKHAHLFA